MQNETTLIVGVIVAIFAVVGFYVTKGLNLGATILKEKTNNEQLKSLIDRVNSTALIVVQALNQTIVDDLKAKSEDGKLTSEEIEDIKNRALNSLLNSIGVEGKELLTKTFGDLNSYLTQVIESKVGEAKALKSA